MASGIERTSMAAAGRCMLFHDGTNKVLLLWKEMRIFTFGWHPFQLLCFPSLYLPRFSRNLTPVYTAFPIPTGPSFTLSPIFHPKVVNLSIRSSIVYTMSLISSFSDMRWSPCLRKMTSTSLLSTRSATCMETCQGTSESLRPWISRTGQDTGMGLWSMQWFSASFRKSMLKV